MLQHLPRRWGPPNQIATAAAIAIIAVMFRAEGAAQQPGGSGSLGPAYVEHARVGILDGNPLERLGISAGELRASSVNPTIRYAGITRFINKTRAVVTGTLDDSTEHVPKAIDALDRYGIKATIAVSTLREPISRLWPRLRQAVDAGHEIGSHSRRHQCQWPDTESFCREAYSQDEIAGSRDDILAHTEQPYVWTWVYPCGNCADYEFIHLRLNRAGYLVARNYPDERRGGILVPDLQTWALDPYNAAFTQVAQKKGGVAPAGRTDVADLNAKFDEVYKGESRNPSRSLNRTAEGGIYHFMSHPQWLDYGADKFFEQHLSYLGGRPDVWYVPLGPLYGYQIVRESTVVSPIGSKEGWERFAVYNRLDPAIFNNSITIEFLVPAARKVEIRSGGKPVAERAGQLTDRWNQEYFRREGDSILLTIRPNTILELRSPE
jgi:peptidoglycan/xylan/chitin deacetylase (PgdA/CDA1 family)